MGALTLVVLDNASRHHDIDPEKLEDWRVNHRFETWAKDQVHEEVIKIDDNQWVSIGAGLRSSFSASETARQWSTHVYVDNIRLYLNGQIHRYFKVEIDPLLNVWMGRMLVPAERREMNGPFYSAVYDLFSHGTPFEPADYNGTIRDNGTSAGAYGRDDGTTLWGAGLNGHFQYAVGFFRGLRNGANNQDNVLYAQRWYQRLPHGGWWFLHV